ncbi:hypothetical protein AMTRI_Chr04g189910 [Amborella trichopoda]|uniref:F-box domain-containing protein n=1 Tax=Amborella trichopoda TaxID=13333 RepID=W1NF29_AMBTC|nr:F-box/kelch-repeat protein At1g26930 [Amborella trichopoda]ERM94407.1 hypothetical protein AMTR_s00010p00255050 [Amborella trichopoda]|eukprot:XP_006827170.1 F-box/kelch-repeat protein At1g26930 [Amborella trichopoda]
MLEGQSCLVSRVLPGSCEQESKWYYMYPIEVQKGNKRSLSMEESNGTNKRSNSSNLSPRKIPRERNSLFDETPSDQDDHQGQGEDSNYRGLGRDMVIDCFIRCSRSDYGSIALLNRAFRLLVQSGKLYQLRRKMGVMEHWIYFSCSLAEWEAYDPNSTRWMHLPPMPSNECFKLSDKESLAVGTELLVFGKDILSFTTWRYSILRNNWTPAVPMESPRCLFGSASQGVIAIVAGGCDIQGKILDSAELYNSENGSWETLPKMNSPRKMCSGFFMDDKFYVIGGRKVQGENQVAHSSANPQAQQHLTSGEEFNLETRTWRTIPNMFPRRGEFAHAPPLVAVVHNELYAADHEANEVMKYDKENNTWSVLGKLPERAASVNGWGLAFKACGGQVIVIGGYKGTAGGTVELYSWVPKEGPPTWRLLASKQLNAGTFVYNCAVMGC